MIRIFFLSLFFLATLSSFPVGATSTVMLNSSDEFWVTNGVAPRPEAVKILIVGDGFISGRGLPDEKQSIAGLIIEKLGVNNTLYPRVVKSIATENETSASLLARVKYIISLRPHLIILAVGMNDAIANIDPDIIHNNLSFALSELGRVGIYTVILGIQAHPKMGGYEYMASFNNIYPRLVEQFRLPFAPNISESVANNTMLLQRDEMYPNAEGAKIIAELLRKNHLEMIVLSMAKNIREQFMQQRIKERDAKAAESLQKRQKTTIKVQ